jgi:ATP-dependent Lon protease
MPEGGITVLLQGRARIELQAMNVEAGYYQVQAKPLYDDPVEDRASYLAIAAAIKETGAQIIHLSPHLPQEALNALNNIQNPQFLVNFVAAHLNIELPEKQALLELNAPYQKAELVLEWMHKELQMLRIKEEIENKVRIDLEKQQRDYILNQQLKTIQDELGQNPQQQDLEDLERKAEEKQWSKEVRDKFNKELKRLKRTNPMAPEYTILLNYLELMVELPWNEYTQDDFDLDKAEDILNRDHFGLEKIKDRILEYLAVLQLRKDMKAPILCFAGPPGVGKTSLGKSIATALGRKYVRMSLGGLHDEAELRGHRKTYIGALPGRIIQSIRKAGSSNPVFILDEIDKIGNSFRGDPSSALLEVLDPEQNTAFYDNYLETEYDLSKVLFIATANNLATVQPALLDRMEIIELSGYSVEEKVEIAQRHLIPKQLEEHGLEPEHLQWQPGTIQYIAERYTRESGVRSLDRVMASVMRYVARRVAKDANYRALIGIEQLEDILGQERINPDAYENDGEPGVAIGLAWTQVGGDILFIEASLSPGKGQLTLTGNLGEVMKESATAALSFLRSKADSLGIEPSRFDQTNIHIHVPAGAIPKDGPSAGITMLSALASAFLNKPLRPKLAMTGEITLRGKVLPVGGIKEKVLAAKRAGISDIILCADNHKDIKEINAQYLQGLTFHYVKRMEEVLNLALG